ncbi:MAG: hypothetical protein M3Y51_05755 [Actinomycetota bacterium]|nr:hypothetical protein [Actinomycetota bacterium]
MTEQHHRDVRTTGRRHRVRTAAVLGLLGGALVVSGCSFDRDEPATVTLPENDTTTTMPRGSLAPGTTDPESAEPLPIAWKLQVGGPGDDRLLAVTGHQAAVVAVGDTTQGLGTPVQGSTDAVVAVVTTEGEIVAAEQDGSTGADGATGVAANEQSVVVCGVTDGTFGVASAGGQDAWCGSTDDTGLLGQVQQLGGPDAERITGVTLADEDPVGYASGVLSGRLPGAEDPSGRGLGGGDALALQTDAVGRPLWARQFGTPFEDGALGVAATADADGILVGYTDGDLEGASKGGRDAWISRFDADGKQRWVTQVGSASSDTFTSVTTTGEARRGTEQFIAGGTTDGDLDGAGTDVAVGATDAVVGSFGTNGALLWTAQFGSSGVEDVTGIVADGAIVYVTGTTDGEFGTLLETDGGPGGATDIFLAAVDAVSGEVLWSSRFGTEGDDRSSGITTTEDGLLVISGSTTGQFADTPPNGGVDGILVAFPLASSGGGAASSV